MNAQCLSDYNFEGEKKVRAEPRLKITTYLGAF